MVSKSAFLSALLLILLGTSSISEASPHPDESAIYGKIAGRVIDAATGDPLPGVNVVIEGTTQGTATDMDGEYVIIRVRPGTYSVRAQFLGFQTQVIANVEVIIDQTTRVDFRLGEEVLEGEEIVVTAERPIVQVDRTTTTAVVGEEQLEALPVLGISDAINLQAGVVDILATASAFAALKSDGSVVTWGQAGNGGNSSAVATALNGTVDVLNITSTDSSFAALRRDGSVLTWGQAGNGGNANALADQLQAGVVDIA
ncbi:MAG: carboxypeptidase-like regulatory domain-containing protein, partial [Bacteroidetes bacterium]|nr:carboxypeptidase-like regulatory domain-containing protein [Bacteroidota bacterium]